MARLSKKNRENLEKYLTSNYTRRVVLLERWGYTSQEEYFKAMSYVPKRARKTISKTVVKPTKTKKSKEVPVDMVIAFDTTGSMNAYIEDVKHHASTVVKELLESSPMLKIKLVAFGDYCDMPSENEFGSAYQQSDLISASNTLINFIKSAKNTSGGDSDEFYELVIRKINRETPWRENSKRVVLFIADCNPHNVGYSCSNRVQNNKIDWREEAREAAKLGIVYDTLSIHGDKFPWYRELALITGGVYAPFSSSNKTTDLVAASTLSRTNKVKFMEKARSAESSGDSELKGIYKSYGKLL